MPVDMAQIGIFDRQAFLQHFEGDFGELFEWSSFEVDATDGAVEIAPDDASHLRALVVIVNRDGVYRVETLLEQSKTVGLAITPLPPRASDDKPRRWTRVDVKFVGIGDPWYYLDDWDYPHALEDVLDSLATDVSIEASMNNNESSYDDAAPDAAVRDYLPNFRGVSWVRAYLDEEGKERAQGLTVSESLASATLPADATVGQVADLTYSVVREIREKIADER